MLRFTFLPILMFIFLICSCESPVTDQKSQKANSSPLTGTWGTLINHLGKPLYLGYTFTEDTLIVTEVSEGEKKAERYYEKYAYTSSNSEIILENETMLYKLKEDTLFLEDVSDLFIKGVTPENADFSNFSKKFDLSDLFQSQLKDQNGNTWSFSSPDSQWGASYSIEGNTFLRGKWSYDDESGVISLTQDGSDSSNEYHVSFNAPVIRFKSRANNAVTVLSYQ